MHTLRNWKARRAGGRITVTGTEDDGSPGKIIGVDVVRPGVEGNVFADDKNGQTHLLIA